MIDVHAHTVLAGVMGCAGEYGPELGIGPEGRPRFRAGNYVLDGVDYTGSPFMDPDARLRLNDHLGIDLQVLSPNPITYFHHIEADVADGFCRWHNDELAKIVALHPDRFRGFAQLPMQSVERAVIEFRRAVNDCGMLGAYIGTDFGIDIVLSSHLLDEVERVCDNVIILAGGVVTKTAALDDIAGDVTGLILEVDEAADRVAMALSSKGCHVAADGEKLVVTGEGDLHLFIRDTVAELGVGLRRLSPQQRNLEDVFFDANAPAPVGPPVSTMPPPPGAPSGGAQ